MKDIFTILLNALSYNGDFLLSIINYVLLIIVILPFVVTDLKTKASYWWIVLLCSFLLQALLWFVLQVQGISIIWNALFGFLLLVFIRRESQWSAKSKVLIYFSMGATVFANLYFGLSLPFITSIAHIAAIVFGMGFLWGRKAY